MPKNRNKAKDENARKRLNQQIQHNDFDSPSSSTPSSPPLPVQPGLPTPSSSLGSSTSMPPPEERLIDFSSPEGPSPASIDLLEQDNLPTFPTPSRKHTLSSGSVRSISSASDILGKSTTTLKQNLRGTVGSSILGGGAPSPPMVSTTEGFGSFSVSPGSTSSMNKDSQPAQGPVFPPSSPGSPIPTPTKKGRRLSTNLGLGLSFSPPSIAPSRIQSRSHSQGLPSEYHPGPGNVIQSHFETLPDGRKWLVIISSSGVHVWDLSTLGAFQEILHLHTSTFSNNGETLTLRDARVVGDSVLGFLLSPLHGSGGQIVFYSVETHNTLHSVSLEGNPVHFNWSGKGFLLVATTSPPTIQIYHLAISLQHCELKHLHTIPSASLAPFNHLRHIIQSLGISQSSTSASGSTSRSHSNERGSSRTGIDVEVEGWQHSNFAEPVFAIQGRLLVYASSAPASSSPSTPTHQRRKSAGVIKDQGRRGGRFGSLLGSAVKSLATSLSSTPPSGKDDAEVSRSAPSTFTAPWSRSEEEKGGWLVALDLDQLLVDSSKEIKLLGRWHIPPSSSLGGADIPRIPTSSPFTTGREERDVITLEAVLAALPNLDQEREGNISTLELTSDGLTILVGLRDGREVRSYSLVSLLSLTPRPLTSLQDDKDVKNLKEIYTIHRGFTPSALSGLTVSEDGRWVLIGSWKRGTGHVVAINPYGGKTDVRSHISGRVLDPFVPISPEVPNSAHPLLRIRPNHSGLSISVVLADYRKPNTYIIRIPARTIYTFLPSPASPQYAQVVPPVLIPTIEGLTPESFLDNGSSPRSSSFSSKRLSASPTAYKRRSGPPGSKAVRPRNFQDIVLFDPSLGVVELRRISVDAAIPQQSGHSGLVGYGDRLRDYVPQLPHGLNLNSLQTGVGTLSQSVIGFISGTGAGTGGPSSLGGAVSVSPSSAQLGALGGSPGSWTTVGSVDSSASPSSSGPQLPGIGHGDGDLKMSAKEGLVARWDVGGTSETEEIKKPAVDVQSGDKQRSAKDYLAESELSTFPRPQSRQTFRPPPSKSLYLTHQFTFSTLGEDYHALIRSYHFSSLLASTSSMPIAVRRDVQVLSASGSSPGEAIRDSLDVENVDVVRGEEVLPMYPNGFGTRDAGIPINIRRMARDGGEGLGRLGREVIGRSRRVSSGAGRYVRSRIPSSAEGLDEASNTPLEFDESDEQFDESHLRTSLDDLSMDEQGEIWENGWGDAERGAVKEMETFEDFLEGVNVERGGTIKASTSTAPVPTSADHGISAGGEVKKKKGKKSKS